MGDKVCVPGICVPGIHLRYTIFAAWFILFNAVIAMQAKIANAQFDDVYTSGAVAEPWTITDHTGGIGAIWGFAEDSSAWPDETVAEWAREFGINIFVAPFLTGNDTADTEIITESFDVSNPNYIDCEAIYYGYSSIDLPDSNWQVILYVPDHDPVDISNYGEGGGIDGYFYPSSVESDRLDSVQIGLRFYADVADESYAIFDYLEVRCTNESYYDNGDDDDSNDDDTADDDADSSDDDDDDDDGCGC